jgi:hypothetical protein
VSHEYDRAIAAPRSPLRMTSSRSLYAVTIALRRAPRSAQGSYTPAMACTLSRARADRYVTGSASTEKHASGGQNSSITLPIVMMGGVPQALIQARATRTLQPATA